MLEGCPRETYLMDEAGFANRCGASKEIGCVLCSALAPLLARLRTMECLREALPHVSNIHIDRVAGAYLDHH